MFKLNLTQAHEVEKNGQPLVLNQPKYNVTDINFLKDNGFFKCFKCGEWFDYAFQTNFHSKHPKEHYNDREYCRGCFVEVEAQLKI